MDCRESHAAKGVQEATRFSALPIVFSRTGMARIDRSSAPEDSEYFCPNSSPMKGSSVPHHKFVT
jgi:hypothetical protein